MNVPRSQRRDELREISKLIDAPDSWPSKHMRIKRENQSADWSETADTERSDASLESYVEALDAVGEILATKLRS